MAETADVIVVGAGIMGASIAYHLARQGVGRVVVLERETVCSGSTALASGGIRHQYANRVGIELRGCTSSPSSAATASCTGRSPASSWPS